MRISVSKYIQFGGASCFVRVEISDFVSTLKHVTCVYGSKGVTKSETVVELQRKTLFFSRMYSRIVGKYGHLNLNNFMSSPDRTLKFFRDMQIHGTKSAAKSQSVVE